MSYVNCSPILPQESVHAVEVLSQKTPSIVFYMQPHQEYTWVEFAPFLKNSCRRILVNPNHHPAELAAQLGFSDVILLQALGPLIKPLPLTVSFGEHDTEIVSFWVAGRDEALEMAHLNCFPAADSWPVIFPRFPGPFSLTAKNLRHLVLLQTFMQP